MPASWWGASSADQGSMNASRDAGCDCVVHHAAHIYDHRQWPFQHAPSCMLTVHYPNAKV